MSKLIFKENNLLPKERAAHAAYANNKKQMLIHGESNYNHNLFDDELWLFNLDNDNNKNGFWSKINIKNKGPGKRYGHTLSYVNNFYMVVI